LEFSITSNGQNEDVFTLKSSDTPTTEGHISLAGSEVWLGQAADYVSQGGVNPTLIGTIDDTKNGLNGQAFKINLINATIVGGINPITNGDFSNGFNNWTAVQAEVDLGNNLTGTSIATPNDADVTYPPQNDGDDGDLQSGGNTWEVDVMSGRLRLQEKRMWVSSYGVVHGPAAYSDLFSVDGGGNLLFDWEANYINDDYHVTGYLIDESNSITIALDVYGTTGSGEASVTVPETGNYRFVFVSGTFDRTGGRLAGASMYIDNVRVEDAMVLDNVIETIIENMQFNNTSDTPEPSKTLTVTVEDYEDKSDSQTATITLTPINDPPISVDINGTGDEASTITSTLTAADVDNTDPNSFTFTLLTQPTHMTGSVSIATPTYSSGTFEAVATYTHDDTQNYSDDFSYRANDGTDNSEIVTATITINNINDAPIAADVTSSGSEAGTITTTLTATDVDNTNPSTFTFSIVDQPTYKTANISIATPTYSSGTFSAVATYTHDGSETTSDSFTYKANDGSADSNVATATIAISAVNDSPIASNVNGNGDNDDTITTTLTATDADHTSGVTFSIISNPNQFDSGTMSIGSVSYDSGSKTFSANATYTHDASGTTSDSFTYKATDGTDSNTATATIAIGANDNPVSSNVNGSGNEGGTITITLTATDVQTTETFSFIIVTTPSNITGSIDESAVVDNNSGSGTYTKEITYTHDGSETTSDSFTY
ncbi:uncharacterized protein METZ01_LOCUS88880, partial [marine metagenome]